MQKLIKLSETHYIIVDDSEIKEGDWIFRLEKVYQFKDDMPVYNPKASKITHSTQPLSDKPHYAEYDMLTLSEVEEAINGYSVEKMADSLFEKESHHILHPQHQMRECYIKGFNAHKELVKDKLFTVEDIRKILYAFETYEGDKFYASEVFDEVMKQFLPKTEWDVTFDEQGKISLAL